MGRYQKKIRDAKIQNGRYDRQERLDYPELTELEPLPEHIMADQEGDEED